MKKIFSILLFLLSFVIVLSISLSRNEVYGMSNAIVANKFSMMGRSYDITKGIVDNVSESNYGVNIFESDWIDEVKNSNVINEVGRTSVESVYSRSLYEFRSKYKLDDKIENSGSLGIDDLFSLDIAQLFDIRLDKVDKTKKANFYYNLEAIYQSYIYDMLYNYSKKDYTDHLDPYYDGYLGLLFRHVIEPSVFFKKFGTHILMRGTFGCEYDINYSVLSSSATFSTNIVINAADKIGGNIINSMLKKAEIESDIDFSLNTLFEQEIDDASVNLKMSCKCETPTIFLNFSDMKNNYNTSINNWNSDNAVFLTASHEGYIPLWEFIPDKYATQRQWFIDECKNYIRNNCLDLKNIEDELYSLDKVEKPCLIRADELKISANSYSKNKYDTLNLKSLTGYKINELISGGFNYLDVTLTAMVREENDGYQHFAIFNKDKDGNDVLIVENRYEHGIGYKDESYKEAVISFKAIDINKLSTDDILIKYKGTGSGSDTWYNENVHVTFCFYR